MSQQHLSIILLSPEYWGKSFVSKHHYANYLSKNHRVIFLEPSHGWNIRNLFVRDWKVNQVNKNLWVVSFSHILPGITNFPKFIQRILFKFHTFSLNNFLRNKLDFSVDLVWSFDPHRFWDLKVFSGSKTIYHCVDFHPGASYEREAVASSDIFLGISTLIDSYLYPFAKKYIKIGHGADIIGFNQSSVKIKIPGNNKIKAGYIGNFHKHVNYSLLEKLAVENTDVDFILIGPTSSGNLASKNTIGYETLANLKKLFNVFFIGEIESSLIFSYLREFDINMVLFKKEYERIHCNPHKMMGYFYSGKITISNRIEEYFNMPEQLILIAENEIDYLRKFKNVKENLNKFNSIENMSYRKSFAEINSYENKIKLVLEQFQS